MTDPTLSPLRRLLAVAIAAALMLACFARASAAQGGAAPGAGREGRALTGVVEDAEAGGGLPFASVAVWRAADSTLATGALTDDAGAFRVAGVPPGRYYVVVSYIGYASRTLPGVAVGGADVDLGTVGLAPDVEALEEVEVTAARARVEVQADRTVYNVAGDPVLAGGTATDALETIPSVDVDASGNLRLRGAGNVAVLINGRPSPVRGDFLGAYLQQLPAGVIERIEVIPNPSARYDPSGMGGIINIVLRENTELGLGGGLAAGADTRGGYNATGTLTYGRGPLNLTASYGLRRTERDAAGTRFRINRYLDPVTTLLQESDDASGGTSHLLNLSADYALGRRTTLTAAGQLALRGQASDERTTYLEADADRTPTLAYERLAAGAGDGWSTDLRLGLTHAFASAAAGGERAARGGRGRGGRGGGGRRGGGGHELSVEARLSSSANEDADAFTERLLGDPGAVLELQRTAADQRERSASLEVDYTRPLLGFRLETGYRGELERTHSDFFSERDTAGTGAFLPDLGLNNAFDYAQRVHAVYGQLARAFGPLSVQAGLRAEAAATTFTLLNSGGAGGGEAGEAYDNDHLGLFPSAFVSFAASERDVLRASFSRRVGRLRTRQLNPFPRFTDPLNVSVGNPALRPQYTAAFEVGYTRHTPWGSLSLAPYYRRTTDVIRRVQTLREDGVTVSTFENLATSDSYGVEAVASFEGAGALDGLRGHVSLEGYRQMTDGTSDDVDLRSDAFGWGGRLNLSYALPTGTDLQANARYRAAMGTEQGRSGASVMMDLALRQRLLGDRASLTLRARDPLGLMNTATIIDEPDLYQEFERSMGGPQVGLTFTYVLGQRPRTRDRQENVEREEPADPEAPDLR